MEENRKILRPTGGDGGEGIRSGAVETGANSASLSYESQTYTPKCKYLASKSRKNLLTFLQNQKAHRGHFYGA